MCSGLLLTETSGFWPTTSVDLFGDSLRAPQICKDFFPIRPERHLDTVLDWEAWAGSGGRLESHPNPQTGMSAPRRRLSSLRVPGTFQPPVENHGKLRPGNGRCSQFHCGSNAIRLFFKDDVMKTSSNRHFWFAGLAAATLLATGCHSPKDAKDACCSMPGPTCTVYASVAPPTKESQAAMTPQSALAELKAGNARFVAGHPLTRNFPADVKATASGQYPFAVVLSCLDSRQPIEIVLDQGIGDIFSARVAGNVLDDDILGSMEFACKASGAKLIAVIGHSNCGAIKGAVDGVELGNLTSLLAKIQPAIGQIPDDGQPRNSKNLEFVDKVSEANVRLVMQQIRERSPILREMIDQGQISLVGGLYDLATGEVHFYGNTDK